MVFIKDQQENKDCHYQAHVWFSNHSHQCGCFGTKKAAEQWAYWLQKKIVTGDLFKATRGTKTL
ncbi:hypothetical protein Ga0123462_0829 [Mariprofundus ferrinatatus]|uniref:AP2 domain-containing protein n=1 Tax=Mariprofundus ferrinatatus TaxID=1921087 RepID=A0A2K8L624_9PROT|nr:hypothetical protein [Mariprofundus ferrinatatus]ATX81699.1 hypothetical protein Ga0123462_0829 [Mariprofundus ferrinatatus]